MAFHRDRPPTTTMVYRYGARPPYEPALVEEQIRAAHRYQNQLIEIERARRDRYHDILDTVPGVAQSRAEVNRLDVEIAERVGKLKHIRSLTRRRTPDAKLPVAVRALRFELKAARTQLHHREKAAREVVADALSESEKTAQAAVRAARAECECYWGTYLIVERSIPHSGPPPHFRRWNGAGHIAVQLQGGMTEEELLSGDDTRLRLQIRDNWGPRGSRNRAMLQIRVGSEGRQPIMVSVPIYYHRRIPEGSRIKWAQLVRLRIGLRYEWSVCLTVETAGARKVPDKLLEPQRVPGRVLAIDLGWRAKPNGVRVAYGYDGANAYEVLLPTWLLEGYDLVHDLRSIRDKALDVIRPKLVDWLRDHQPPEWLAEATTHLARWRSTARLSSLVLRWKRDRFEGDAGIVTTLEKWRRQDAHLYQWERDLEKRLIRTRCHMYRNWAAWIAREYDAVVFEGFSLAKMKHKPTPDDMVGVELVGHHVPAAPGEFRTQVLQTMSREGRHSCLIPAKNTTRRCTSCGEIGLTRTKDLYVVCDKCGVHVDQDCNASRQIHAYASGGVVSKSPGALVVPNGAWYEEIMREPVDVVQRRARLRRGLSQGEG